MVHVVVARTPVPSPLVLALALCGALPVSLSALAAPRADVEALGANAPSTGTDPTVNAKGQQVGTFTYLVNGASKGSRAFLLSDGVRTNLGSLGTNSTGIGNSSAVAINASGQVAGTSDFYEAGVIKGQRAFLWSNGVMVNLGSPSVHKGIAQSRATGLNATGQVVGNYIDFVNGINSGWRTFIYNGGQIYRLDTLAPAGWRWGNATSINDLGQVTVTGVYKNQQQAGLLTLHPDWQGGSGNWSDANHWNFAGMGAFGFTPGAPHAVHIETTSATTVTGPASASVASLTLASSVAKGATLDLSGGVLRTANGALVGSGGVLTGSGQLLGGLQTQEGSEVNVGLGQRLQVDTAEFGADVHNDGELVIDTSATLAGGTYSGAGSLSGAGVLTVAHGAVFAPGNSPALVSVDVQTVFDAGALLQMELGGTVAGTGHDKLVFGQSVTLDGDLELLWLNGFTGSAGQTFDLFDWNGGVTGSFAHIALPTLASGLQWDLSDLYTGGSLKVNSMVAAVPEPQTYALMLACLLVVFTVHKRRQA
jgi:probable HAF family extracellular repeat protein